MASSVFIPLVSFDTLIDQSILLGLLFLQVVSAGALFVAAVRLAVQTALNRQTANYWRAFGMSLAVSLILTSIEFYFFGNVIQ